MADEQPLVMHVSRQKHFLEGTVQSRSEPDRLLQVSISLQAVIICPCKGGAMRDRCDHPRAILEMLSQAELVQYVLDARHVPPPIAPAEL